MKVVILAGGYGTRLSEETGIKPKPMVEIGDKPILWHIMKMYTTHDLTDFIICCGYKGGVIKKYFTDYFLLSSDVTLKLEANDIQIHKSRIEPWEVTLVDTGLKTMTGGRLLRIQKYIDDETFCMTYGDGVSDLNIGRLIEFHENNNCLATLTAVQPPGRFGVFHLEDGETKIKRFREKPQAEKAWINGGFFVLEPGIFDYIDDDSTVWEREPLQKLARDQQLSAFRHQGYWQNMDTLRDQKVLEKLWRSGSPPWKTWQESNT
jgi:glucose-1-phosphate cytidylyltransferase